MVSLQVGLLLCLSVAKKTGELSLLNFAVGCSFKIKTKMFSRELGRNQFSGSAKETVAALAEFFYMREKYESSSRFKSSC